jgi:hypothetical protein
MLGVSKSKFRKCNLVDPEYANVIFFMDMMKDQILSEQQSPDEKTGK